MTDYVPMREVNVSTARHLAYLMW